METIGKRIAWLRKAKEWSRPELGRQMAKAIGRETPFTGELIRLYETDVNRPTPDARRALAAVFGKSEAFIEFGHAHAVHEPGARYGGDYSPIERQLVERFRAADHRWRVALQLLAALAAGDEFDAESYASSEGVVPVRKTPLMEIDERGNKSRRAHVRARKTRG